MNYQIYSGEESLNLESGKQLNQWHLAYHTFGKLNATKNNVIWIFHALTANSNPTEWWQGLVGENCVIDIHKYFVVCVNMPQSCYGSIQPLDVDPISKTPYYHNFPLFTTRDMVKAYSLLAKHLQIGSIYLGIGGSMGGQQLLEWAIEDPHLFKNIIPIATNAVHSAWGIAFNTSQRWCIENDRTWNNKNANAGKEGLKIARSIALLSYRNYNTYKQTQYGSYDENKPIDEQIFRANTYQYYQGEKLANRFNAYSYWYLTKSMDLHNVGRNRISVEKALEKITANSLIIGIKSDILFPVEEQEFLAAHIKNAQLKAIESDYGHDGFLLEIKKISALINGFLKRKPLQKIYTINNLIN